MSPLAPLLCAALAWAATPAAPGLTVLSDGAILSFQWTLADDPAWLAPDDGSDPHYARFADAVRARLDARPRALLGRQRALFARRGGDTATLDWTLAHAKLIRPVSRLEAKLFATHWSDADPQKREFQAYVLRRAGLLRVYYTQDTREHAWPEAARLRERVAADMKDGWLLYAHLHVHPFFFDNPEGDIAGTVAPSPQDAALFKELAVWGRARRAWITNGLDTLDVPYELFPTLPSD